MVAALEQSSRERVHDARAHQAAAFISNWETSEPMQRRKLPNKKPQLPLCGIPVRENVDIGVMWHVKACDDLLDECARWLSNARGGDAAAEAQRTVLLNLKTCLSEAVFGMLVLLNHGAAGAVLILERATIEYYGRASYYMKEPDHALWAVEIDRLQVLIDNETRVEQRTALIRQITYARREYAHVTPEARIAAGKVPFHRVRILDMIRIGLDEQAARRYGSASLVLHGDLYSSRIMSSHGAEAMNAAMLEAASGIVAFCNLMLAWLPRAPKGLLERVLEAEEETARLSKRYGRAYLIASA
jgi:hypothetical protein